jgi:hypothetical protein
MYLYDERAMGRGCDALCSLRWNYHLNLFTPIPYGKKILKSSNPQMLTFPKSSTRSLKIRGFVSRILKTSGRTWVDARGIFWNVDILRIFFPYVSRVTNARDRGKLTDEPDTLYLIMDNCVGQNKSQVNQHRIHFKIIIVN